MQGEFGAKIVGTIKFAPTYTIVLYIRPDSLLHAGFKLLEIVCLPHDYGKSNVQELENPGWSLNNAGFNPGLSVDKSRFYGWLTWIIR